MPAPRQAKFELARLDRWIQRLALAALLTMALALVALGIAFYAPSASAQQKLNLAADVPVVSTTQTK